MRSAVGISAVHGGEDVKSHLILRNTCSIVNIQLTVSEKKFSS